MGHSKKLRSNPVCRWTRRRCCTLSVLIAQRTALWTVRRAPGRPPRAARERDARGRHRPKWSYQGVPPGRARQRFASRSGTSWTNRSCGPLSRRRTPRAASRRSCPSSRSSSGSLRARCAPLGATRVGAVRGRIRECSRCYASFVGRRKGDRSSRKPAAWEEGSGSVISRLGPLFSKLVRGI